MLASLPFLTFLLTTAVVPSSAGALTTTGMAIKQDLVGTTLLHSSTTIIEDPSQTIINEPGRTITEDSAPTILTIQPTRRGIHHFGDHHIHGKNESGGAPLATAQVLAGVLGVGVAVVGGLL